MKYPKIKVEYADCITIRDIKYVKEYAREQRDTLPEQLHEICEKVIREHDSNLYVSEVLTATATYYCDYKMPVFYIRAEGFDDDKTRNNEQRAESGGKFPTKCYMEIYCSLSEYEQGNPPIIHLYH